MGTAKIRLSDDNGFTTKLHIRCHEADHKRFLAAANRAGLTLSEFSRRALSDAVLAMDRFFYVRLQNGGTHPALTEVGYEYIENAQRFANRVNGKVIRATIESAPAGAGRITDRGDADSGRVDPGSERPHT